MYAFYKGIPPCTGFLEYKQKFRGVEVQTWIRPGWNIGGHQYGLQLVQGNNKCGQKDKLWLHEERATKFHKVIK